MKIGALNSAYNRVQKNPNFAGIWGKSEIKINDNIMYDHSQEFDCGTYDEVTIKPYYPFLDETDADIEKIKEENTKNTHYGYGENDMVERNYSTVVKIMPKIPVSAAEYNAYIARELLSKQELEVEDKLKGAHLQQFLNVPPKQIS